MGELVAALTSVLVGITVGIGLACFNRKLNRHDQARQKHEQETNARAELRKRESFLSLELQMAIAKMSFATATALRNGHSNGEVDEGIKAYEAAKEKYLGFLNAQARDYLQ